MLHTFHKKAKMYIFSSKVINYDLINIMYPRLGYIPVFISANKCILFKICIFLV